MPSFSVIVLPPQPAFYQIHGKSFPFCLQLNEFDDWLNSAIRDTDAYNQAMTEGIRFPMRVAKVKSPNDLAELDVQFIQYVLGNLQTKTDSIFCRLWQTFSNRVDP